MNRLAATLAASCALSALPTAAFAVNVSSGDGSGNQSVAVWYKCGAYMTGSLKSTNGKPVYFNGDVVYDNEPDADWGRYTKDTTSLTPVSRGGVLGTDSCSNSGMDGVHVKICRNVNNLPDSCGSWSATIRKP